MYLSTAHNSNSDFEHKQKRKNFVNVYTIGCCGRELQIKKILEVLYMFDGPAPQNRAYTYKFISLEEKRIKLSDIEVMANLYCWS